MGVITAGRGVVGSLTHELGSLKVLADAGVIRPIRPDKVAKVARIFSRWGKGHAAGYIVSAIVAPESDAIIDELGTLSFAEVDSRTNRLAHALSDAGVKEGDGVGDHVPQPSRVRGVHRGGGKARRQRPLPQHGLRRAAAERRGQA